MYVLGRNKKNTVYPCKPQFYYLKMGVRGSNYIGMFRDVQYTMIL